jgi:hypothetical protein
MTDNEKHTETINAFNDDMSRIHDLCTRLSKAARIIGPCAESMACIDAQNELMKPFNDAVTLMVEKISVERPNRQHDAVNHPKHYTSHPSGIECITVTEHMGFNLGNALKYIWRCDLKADAIEDLKKAVWYIEREIAKRSAACKK